MKKIISNKTWIIILLLTVCALNQLSAQVITATLSGVVKDAKGEGLPAATVTVEYPDAGIRQTLATRSDGRFTVPNLRVGGPYRVTVNHVSHKPEVTDSIYLEL